MPIESTQNKLLGIYPKNTKKGRSYFCLRLTCVDQVERGNNSQYCHSMMVGHANDVSLEAPFVYRCAGDACSGAISLSREDFFALR